jgi:uncharacterized protein (TIGR02757 family)
LDIKAFLDKQVVLYNNPIFIESDPIQIPHSFSKKENIEISAFLTATIAWGQRTTIIKNARKICQLMDNEPYEFVINASESDLKPLKHFVHRTFQGEDCIYFIKSLNNIYLNHNGLENVFVEGYRKTQSVFDALAYFRKVFFETEHPLRSMKHVSDVNKNAAAKRLNMFLRWMVRKDNNVVDFGIWKQIPPSALYIPLDIHTGNVARELGILTRTQNDWKAVNELTSVLRTFDAADPIKYDFALFGTGVNNK